MSCEHFVNEYIGALQKGRIEDFRRRMRGADALVIDDVHFLAGKDSSQRSSSHVSTRSTWPSGGSSSRAIPGRRRSARSRSSSSRGSSRLRGARRPAYVRNARAILRRKAELKQREIPEDVSPSSRRRGHEHRELEGAVNKLIAYATLPDGPSIWPWRTKP